MELPRQPEVLPSDVPTQLIAKVVVTDAQNERTLVLRRCPYDRHRPGGTDIPGGGVEPDDKTPDAAAARELREEAGIEVDAADLSLFYTERAIREENGVRFCFIGLYYHLRMRTVPVAHVQAYLDADPENREHDRAREATLAEVARTTEYPRLARIIRHLTQLTGGSDESNV